MKNKYKTKNHFSTFLAAISCFILLLSISSCEFFTFSDLKENENAANASEQLSSSNTCNLHITPRFGSESLNSNYSSRSAFPDFSSFSFLGYTFKATSTVLLGEVTGAYNSNTGNISFSFSDATFSEPTEFTFYICDSNGKELFYGNQQITYTTLGSEISKTVYFKSYDSSEVNGHINLKVAVTSDYTLSCEIKNSSDESVCGNTGDPISVDSSGNITTGTDGIAPGTYKAYISVKKGSQLYDYIIQEINVWPDLTTNRWYLPDGTKSQTYNIEISEDQVKFWVKGSGASGPYASDVIVPASYTADGSITKPFTSLNAAIAACTSNSTNYIIKVCGTVSGYSTIGSTVYANSIAIEGVSGSSVDILDGNTSGSVLKIGKAINVSLKNIQLTNGGGGTAYQGGGLYISSGANVVLENDVLITENTAIQKGGGVYIYGNNSKLTMKPGSKITKNYISATNSNEYGGAGVYVGSASYSDNSAELIIEGGEISEHNLGNNIRGAGVFASFSKITLKSGKITKNKATDIGANVMLDNSSTLDMSGGEISYGEINGIGDASAAGVWINNTTSMTMSGGKICYNKVKAANEHIGRGAGVTLWEYGANTKFTMTGGEISNNLVDSTNSDIIQGGAIYIANPFDISGNSYIPYGVNGSKGSGKNDIYICSGKTINIAGELNPPAECNDGIIATVNPPAWTRGLQVISSNSSLTTSITDHFATIDDDFTVTPKTGALTQGILKAPIVVASTAASDMSRTDNCKPGVTSGARGTRELPYSSISAAMAVVDANNSTITINGTLEEQQTVGSTVNGATSLTLIGSSAQAGIDAGLTSGTAITNGSALTIECDIPVTIQSLQIRGGNNNGNGGGIKHTSSTGTLIIETSTRISENKATSGAGIYSEGNVTVNDGLIERNTVTMSTGSGGGVYCVGQFNMTDGEISYNDGASMGGGVNINGDSEISGGNISSNTAEFGAGVYSEANSFILSGTAKIEYNEASGHINSGGGGIYVGMDSDDAFVMTGGQVQHNKAVDGAGIYNAMGLDVRIQGGSIYSNEASRNGGGIYGAFTVTINNCSITFNSAGNGGGIYFNSDGGIFTLEQASDTDSINIACNTATICGGGIFIDTANSASIKGGFFNQNEANVTGGAIFTNSYLDLICPEGKTLSFSSNIDHDADSAKDIFAGNGLLIGGKIDFDSNGSLCLAKNGSDYIIDIKSTLNGISYQIPLLISSSLGWETGDQVIKTVGSSLNLASEITHFKLAIGSSFTSINSEGKLQ